MNNLLEISSNASITAYYIEGIKMLIKVMPRKNRGEWVIGKVIIQEVF